MAARPVVLVVDDDMDTNDSLTDALAREGYSCIGAPDGNRALVLTQQHRPDLVLLDLGLPGMSGIEFLIEKSEMPAVADIPVIVMTGMTGDCKGVLPALCQQCLDGGTECARWACHAPFARSEHRSPRRPAADALHHFSRLLQLETDCWDVHASLQNGGFVLLALLVVYCDGPHCNGADRAAIRLASLGRPVKKMIGGITGWIDEG